MHSVLFHMLYSLHVFPLFIRIKKNNITILVWLFSYDQLWDCQKYIFSRLNKQAMKKKECFTNINLISLNVNILHIKVTFTSIYLGRWANFKYKELNS